MAVTAKVPGRVLGEGRRSGRGEHRPGRRHRQGEVLGRRVRVGVGGRDGDRVAPRRAEGRRARQGAVGRQGDPGRQTAGLGEVIGVSPVAVTAKVPAVFSAKVVDAAEVNTGRDAVTVRVKFCVDVFELASVAVMVIG